MRWLAVALTLLAAPVAHASPWLCTNAYGVKEFSYDPASATRTDCVDHPIAPGNVVRARPRSSEDQPAVDFPRVDAKTQRQRDVARRRILEHELEEEQKSLVAAKKALEQQRKASVAERDQVRVQETLKPLEAQVRVHETNIMNLQRELREKG